MQKSNSKILMVSPFAKVQRGNSLTAVRIQSGLITRGFQIDLLSLEDHNWQEKLQFALKQSEYNLVHGFHALYFSQVLQTVTAIRDLPIILTTTGTDIHYDLEGAQRAMVMDTMQTAQKIVLFNDDFRNRLLTVSPELKDKLITIPQGVYLETGSIKTRQELGFSEADFLFLLPSGLRAVKNIELAIDALAELHQAYPVIRLLIIGAVIDKSYSNSIIDRISTQPWITYLGEIPHDQMASIYNQGDVVLNTSHSEGQPQAALEAMSLGKPCILTAVPGNLNLIQDGKEGFYINTQADLVNAAQTLLNAPALRKEMGNNARKLIENWFTPQKELDDYCRIYEEIIGTKSVRV